MQGARRAQIVVPLVMSVALVATVLATYRNVRDVLATIERGQGDSLLDTIRRLPQEATFAEAYSAFLDEHRSEGLRCIALFDSQAEPITVVGDCLASGEALREVLLEAPSEELIDLGARSRMVRGSPSDSRSTRPLLVEFEPVATRELERGALRGIGIGVASSLVLIGVAIVLWRLSLREEKLMEAVQRDRRLASLGEMAAVLAHEIRNPLAGMKGHAQLLAERLPADTRESEKAALIVREALRLEDLTGGLLSFVRSEQVEREPVDPTAVLEAAAEEVGAGTIVLRCERVPRSFSLDARLMQRVFSNLLRNAVEASPEGARVEVEAAARGAGSDERLEVSVRDHGPGVPESERERIFEPFFTTKVRGTGLGLAVARRIVALHGGTITVANHSEGGAVFTVTIPAA